MFEVRATIEKIEELITQSIAIDKPENIEKVVVHLGTNDVSHNSTDVGQVIINYSLGLNSVRDCFQNAKIYLCSIPPRKGKSDGINQKNETTAAVNRYLHCLASQDAALEYVDTYPSLTSRDSGSPLKNLYDKKDQSGVHLNKQGKDALKNIFNNIFKKENTKEQKRKRGLSTPSSVEKAPKALK